MESQRKRNHQSPGSVSLKSNPGNAPAPTQVSNNYRIPSSNLNQRVSFNNSNEQLDLIHYSPVSPVPNYNQGSPSSERKSSKLNQRPINKSQEDLLKMRTKSATNPNAYHDKITDQRFFNRNFKIKAESTSPVNGNGIDYVVNSILPRQLNESPVSDILHRGYFVDKDPNRNYLTQNLFSQNNLNLSTIQQNQNPPSATTIQLNKLKLLKKRNALKKTLSNAGNNSITATTNLLSSNKDLTNSSSKEDLYKSQNSINFLNNSSVNSMSRHLSRHSLHNADNSNTTNNSYMNISQQMRKSNETIDDLLFNDLKLRDARLKAKNNGSNMIKAKSENELTDEFIDHEKLMLKPNQIVQIANDEDQEIDLIIQEKKTQLASSSFLNAERPKKLSNESPEVRINKAIMANTSYLNRIKSVNIFQNGNSQENSYNLRQRSSINRLNNDSTSLNAPKSGIMKRDKSSDSGDMLNKSKYENETNPRSNGVINDNRVEFKIIYPGMNAEIVKPQNESALDTIDPNNIMSDPVISEQFRKLYEEDEYFQAVHRKCSEWLLRYVIPEMETLRATQD